MYARICLEYDILYLTLSTLQPCRQALLFQMKLRRPTETWGQLKVTQLGSRNRSQGR